MQLNSPSQTHKPPSPYLKKIIAPIVIAQFQDRVMRIINSNDEEISALIYEWIEHNIYATSNNQYIDTEWQLFIKQVYLFLQIRSLMETELTSIQDEPKGVELSFILQNLSFSKLQNFMKKTWAKNNNLQSEILYTGIIEQAIKNTKSLNMAQCNVKTNNR